MKKEKSLKIFYLGFLSLFSSILVVFKWNIPSSSSSKSEVSTFGLPIIKDDYNANEDLNKSFQDLFIKTGKLMRDAKVKIQATIIQ